MEYTIMLMVAIICVIGGLGFGYFIGKSQNSDEEAPQAPPPAAPLQPQYPADALHIWRDHEQKQLVLSIKGDLFRSAEALPAAERKFMQQLLGYLHKWLNLPLSPAPAAETPERAASRPAPAAKRVEMIEPVDAIASSKSIVEQINDILQEKLQTSPLSGRGISLAQTIHGGMVVFVGLEKYEEIDAIPDKDVVAIIRASVKAWEQRS